MSVKRAGKSRKEKCAWCDAKTKWQIVGGFGVIKSACDDHKNELIEFDKERIKQRIQSERDYELRQNIRCNCEPSIAEMDLGIH